MIENSSKIVANNSERNLHCHLYKNDDFTFDAIFNFIENLKKKVIDLKVKYPILLRIIFFRN